MNEGGEMVQKERTGSLRMERQKGFTLLEVIFAVSILTIGILAVASMQGSAIWGNARAMDVADATSLVGDRIEKLAALPYDSADLEDRDGDGASGLDQIGFDGNPDTKADADYGVTFQTTRGKTYSLYWNVAVDTAEAGTKTINVIVVWKDHGREKRLSMRHIKPHIG
jgi:type IV pilus assembly protein PilV